jgi:hypothetical protein
MVYLVINHFMAGDFLILTCQLLYTDPVTSDFYIHTPTQAINGPNRLPIFSSYFQEDCYKLIQMMM